MMGRKNREERRREIINRRARDTAILKRESDLVRLFMRSGMSRKEARLRVFLIDKS